jgi:hypothetical protein
MRYLGSDPVAAKVQIGGRPGRPELHLVEEYARHNGHADLLREAIDGSAGM